MKVQKGIIPYSNRPVWMVLDDNYLPIEAIEKYLHYLDNVGRSPNTIGTYAHNLKLFWEFLRDSQLDWRSINLEQLSDFIHWLRNPNSPVVSIQAQVSKRSEKTINHCLTTVSGFYEFQERIGAIKKNDVYRYQLQPGHKYKSFLHHISKGKGVKTRLLKIKEPKTFPGCLTPEEVNILIEACNTLRDKFFMRLLYETGLRIGEALGLRHEDMVTGKTNEIYVVPRLDNVNNVRGKSGVERVVHVSKELMQWDSAYLCDEYPEDIDCDFVFNVQARALEHGYCARPKMLGDCDIPGFDGCYNCPHWRTNKNFLPILKSTLERTNNVLKKAQSCAWELQIYKNTPIKDNLEKVIKTLEVDND
ncbi:tyrosine-type recombinase/integrase [Scytonema hofmannii]|uniref:tyrosine-type recombinase/integrase n=1 Tax=Scytonema hofmannii TaxID=34078 RepID=UPI00034A13CA|nr:tyrosine-type recombinase/integrase [Scytonema hofmannii]